MIGLVRGQVTEQERVGGINMDVTPRFWIRVATADVIADEISATATRVPIESAPLPGMKTEGGPPEPTLPSGCDWNLVQRILMCASALSLLFLMSGCTAFRPLYGIPVRKLPMEFRAGESRANMETIDLSRLGQTPPPAHLVDSGDVLAIYVEGALGKLEEAPPIFTPQNADSNPSFGYPIPVREDGAISLPLISPVSVRGLTVAQVEEQVRKAYTVDRKILEAGRERILVSLQKSRAHKITVLRQESSNSPLVSISAGGAVQLGQSKKGTGQVVVLHAGENDVLHALTLSGGLPGLDAQNAIYVLRRPRAAALPAVSSIQRPFPRSASNSKKKSSGLIQLTSGQNPYGGRYNLAVQTPNPAAFPKSYQSAPAVQPPWAQPAPDVVSAESVPLEQSGGYDPYAGSRSTTTSYRQGGQPIPARQPDLVPPTAAPDSIQRSPPSPPSPAGNQEPQPAPVYDDQGTYCPPELQPYLSSGTRIIRIPIRLHPGEQAQFSEPDIMLYDGDIVFIESRDTEIFYTGGLLGGGQYQLPRDYDIDVLDAISIAQGRQIQNAAAGGGFGSRIGGISAINQDISVSASNLYIIRRLADGGRINIKIDLNRALRDQNENLMIQPGDHLILRYKPLEAVGAFIERNLLAGSLIGIAAQNAQNGN